MTMKKNKKKLLDILCVSRRKKIVSDIDQIVLNDTIRIDTAYQLTSLVITKFRFRNSITHYFITKI